MILAIDSSNIRAGGGVTHLIELLRAADPPAYGFSEVIIWGGSATLSRIEDRHWLSKRHESLLDRSLFHRVFWQRFRLKKLAREAGSHLLFVPGGSDASGFRPMVTMSQNLLPFEWRELRRFGWSLQTAKGLLLRATQTRTFRNADGVIFLSEYGKDAVLKIAPDLGGESVTVAHGVSPRFSLPPRPQRLPTDFTMDTPCRVIYVSVVEVYKHQWHVARAVTQLRTEGIAIALDIVGPPGAGMQRLREELQRVDPRGEFIQYTGEIAHERLHELYASADIAVFASSCETFGQIVLEAMSAGLPIACARRSAMPEILREAGVYFNPERPLEIAAALRTLIDSPALRAEKADAAFRRAKAFSWKRCAEETFAFLIRTMKRTPRYAE
ncbi:MAG: glycosyltransferase family 4 protein [Gemmatimonadota bacterium]|nr:glycosyltransferase family 4 protein [Gemmatimonadota bacterium]